MSSSPPPSPPSPLPPLTPVSSAVSSSGVSAGSEAVFAPTILLAGGGTGGHIYPNLAIAQRLAEKAPHVPVIFAVSDRPLDAQIMVKQQTLYVPLPARPFSIKPWRWPAFFEQWRLSVQTLQALIHQRNIQAVAATGGFVSAPSLAAGKLMGLPTALVNLDAIPGKANRLMCRRADELFSVYPSRWMASAKPIGLPLRRSAVGPQDKVEALRQLGLDPQREMLFVTGASQGAQSLNDLMVELVGQTQVRRALGQWQVLHLVGDKEKRIDAIADAYRQAQIPARVLAFCDQMGLAWAGASLAISRAGAGSVAEVWANATPTFFYPYPYHRDQHQKFNAEPLTKAGSAVLMADRLDPAANARELAPRLLALISNVSQRQRMVQQMRSHQPVDGAQAVADWLLAQLGRGEK